MSTITHFFNLFKYSFSDKYFWERKREETEKYLSTATDLYDFDYVDSNLVRYYRTEYGPRWKEELNHHLYNKVQKKG